MMSCVLDEVSVKIVESNLFVVCRSINDESVFGSVSESKETWRQHDALSKAVS